MELKLMNRRLMFSCALVSGLVLVVSSGHAVGAPPRIHDLGTLGGNSSFARDINESGQIVGESTTRSGDTHAFLSTPWIGGGRLVDLGTLGGRSSRANALNNSGQVTGASTLVSGGNESSRAFVWTQGRMVALPALNGSPFSEGVDINDAGTVVGASDGVAVRWQGGTVQSLGDLGGGSSVATGINASGVIVGNGPTAAGEFHAWIFKNGVMTDLHPFGAAFSTGDGINSNGDIVGRFESTEGAIHGYLLRKGVFTNLGALVNFSGARAISESGLIAGEGGGDSFIHGVLWDYNRVLVDLGALPGTTFSSAFSVNSAGTIVGVNIGGSGDRAVVWR
jgi:probable HAF family extracellular repeat protein